MTAFLCGTTTRPPVIRNSIRTLTQLITKHTQIVSKSFNYKYVTHVMNEAKGRRKLTQVCSSSYRKQKESSSICEINHKNILFAWCHCHIGIGKHKALYIPFGFRFTFPSPLPHLSFLKDTQYWFKWRRRERVRKKEIYISLFTFAWIRHNIRLFPFPPTARTMSAVYLLNGNKEEGQTRPRRSEWNVVFFVFLCEKAFWGQSGIHENDDDWNIRDMIKINNEMMNDKKAPFCLENERNVFKEQFPCIFFYF